MAANSAAARWREVGFPWSVPLVNEKNVKSNNEI